MPVKFADAQVRKILYFDLHSFWHPGTGRGDGALADAAVHRTAEGLPFLPGRTVKGLMREAVDLAVAARLLSDEAAVALFGSSLPPVTPDDRVGRLEEARYRTEEGRMRFSSACLGKTAGAQDAWRDWAAAREHAPARDEVYTRFASTRIGQDGLAEDATLRAIELVVPVPLYAFVDGPVDAPWDVLRLAVRLFLRGLGSHRNRGLGRVSVYLEET